MLTGAWDFKDILNSPQNRSKNKLVRKTPRHEYMEVVRSRLCAPGSVCLFPCFFVNLQLVNGNFRGLAVTGYLNL